LFFFKNESEEDETKRHNDTPSSLFFDDFFCNHLCRRWSVESEKSHLGPEKEQ